MDLKKKNNFLVIVILLLILVILGLVIILIKGDFKYKECDTLEYLEEDVDIDDNTTLDNSNYIGIYEYEDSSINNCVSNTTLVLNSDYSFIFYIGDCNNVSYYHGKYKVEEKRIVMYDVILQDSTIDYEVNISEEIYFNIVSDDIFTSIFGRSESIRLEKKYDII